MKKILLSLSLLLLSVTMVNIVKAQDFSVSGNGANSTNNVNFQQNNTTNVQQSNNATVNNNVNAGANTGGNNVNSNTGGSTNVQTGNSSVNIRVNNNLNNNSANIECCHGTPVPSKPPSGGGPTVTPPIGGPGNPTSTPGPGGSSNPGSPPGDGGGRGGGGGVGGLGGQILGLAATSGPDTEANIFYTIGLLCLLLGSAVLGKGKILPH